jgi:hypothetical protein
MADVIFVAVICAFFALCAPPRYFVTDAGVGYRFQPET